MKILYLHLLKKPLLSVLFACLLVMSPSFAKNHNTGGGSSSNQSQSQRVPEPAVPSLEYVRVKMGKSIFLDPPEEDEPQVYVRIRDTSGNDWNLQSAIKVELEDSGFIPTRKVKGATYVLQANLLFAEEVSEAQLQNLNDSDYDQGVGDVLASAATGAVAGGAVDVLTGDSNRLGAGSVVGGILGIIVATEQGAQKQRELEEKKATKFFSVVVDIEVRQRAAGEVIRRRKSELSEDSDTDAQQGSLTGNDSFSESSNVQIQDTEEYVTKSKWVRHRVRIIASAKGKYVTIEDVKAPLIKKLTNAISGMF